MVAVLCYPSQLVVVGSVSHSIAIFFTVFRLGYRISTRHVWWEDVLVALALMADVTCLTCIWIQTTSRALSVAFLLVLWPARLSIIFSLIRLTDHPVQRRIAYLVAASFVCMWSALLAQKITLCSLDSCDVGKSYALAQMTTDIISDIALVAVPLHLLWDVKLSHNRKILILSTFGASLLITAITIPHNVMLMRGHTTTTLIFAHVKAALSLVICNLLVIVTFIYRIYSKETVDLNQSLTSYGLFTTIIQIPCNTNPGISLPVQEETSMKSTITDHVSTSRIESVSVPNAEESISTAG